MLKVCLQTGMGKQKYLNTNELKDYLDFPEHDMMFQNPAQLSPAQGSLHPLPPQAVCQFHRCSHCTSYILLWQRPPCCIVIVHISFSGTELAGIATMSNLRAGLLWFACCYKRASLGIWNGRDSHNLCEMFIYDLFLSNCNWLEEGRSFSWESECIALRPFFPYGGAEVLLGWGRVFLLKVLEYNPLTPSYVENVELGYEKTVHFKFY